MAPACAALHCTVLHCTALHWCYLQHIGGPGASLADRAAEAELNTIRKGSGAAAGARWVERWHFGLGWGRGAQNSISVPAVCGIEKSRRMISVFCLCTGPLIKAQMTF